MKILQSNTKQFYIAVECVGNNETIGMGKTRIQAIQDCIYQLLSKYTRT